MSARVFIHPAVFRTVTATQYLSHSLQERGIDAVVFDHPPTSRTRRHLSELVRHVISDKGQVYQRMDGEYIVGSAA